MPLLLSAEDAAEVSPESPLFPDCSPDPWLLVLLESLPRLSLESCMLVSAVLMLYKSCLEIWLFPAKGRGGESAIADGVGAFVIETFKFDPALLRTAQSVLVALAAARLKGVV